MDDEKLIVLVQEREFLYNKFHAEYKKPEKKKAAWKEIGIATGFSDELCSKRWTSLRDRYAREKRLCAIPSGSSTASCKPQLHLFPVMDFLAAYITPRPMRSSTNVLELSSSSSTTQSSSDSPLPAPKNGFGNTEDRVIDLTAGLTNFDFQMVSSEVPKLTTKKRKRNLDDADLLFAEAVDAFKKVCEEDSLKQLSGNEALKGFGKMILSIIGHMSPAKQSKAMERVTALVMEIMLEPEN